MKYIKILFGALLLFSIGVLLMSQSRQKKQFTQADLEEFEILNLCHCNDYLQVRDYDYVAWKSEEAKEERLREIKHVILGRYLSNRLQSQYYQTKYDSTLFFKQGVSVYFGSELDFSRLDSLYYEPIVQHYVRKESKTETLPYLGFGDVNFFFDCYHKVKEIPLEEELELFIEANQNNLQWRNHGRAK